MTRGDIPAICVCSCSYQFPLGDGAPARTRRTLCSCSSERTYMSTGACALAMSCAGILRGSALGALYTSGSFRYAFRVGSPGCRENRPSTQRYRALLRCQISVAERGPRKWKQARSGRNRPDSAEFWSKLAETWPRLVESACPTLGQNRPTSAKLGRMARIRTKMARIWSGLGRLGMASDNVGPKSVDVGTNSAKCGPKLAQVGPLRSGSA